jgi:hypothetical protein
MIWDFSQLSERAKFSTLPVEKELISSFLKIKRVYLLGNSLGLYLGKYLPV